VKISVQNKYNCTNKYRCRVSKTVELRLEGRNINYYRQNISKLLQAETNYYRQNISKLLQAEHKQTITGRT
jgi:hypothetical protein